MWLTLSIRNDRQGICQDHVADNTYAPSNTVCGKWQVQELRVDRFGRPEVEATWSCGRYTALPDRVRLLLNERRGHGQNGGR